MRVRSFGRLLVVAFAFICSNFLITSRLIAGPIGFAQINLTSDVSQDAPNLDPNLRNPWGMSFGPSTPFWVSNQVTGTASLIPASGAPLGLVVTIAGQFGLTHGSPTGQVFVGGMGFNIAPGQAATFVFATLQGTINAWNGGTSAAIVNPGTGAVYTGLAQAGGRLYAADARGHIDVYNQSFGQMPVSGSFVDPFVPSGFTPYNIQTIGGQLYVEYAQHDMPGGYVGVFDLNGNFLRHISDAHLDEPWGITLAPSGFGPFGGALLVGNEGNGMINAFDPTTGAFLGTLAGLDGLPIVNPGLWALAFRAPGSGFDPNALFFTAGINDEDDGLFGEIVVAAVPEPVTLGLVGAGLAALVRSRRRA